MKYLKELVPNLETTLGEAAMIAGLVHEVGRFLWVCSTW
jgi:hypothetical protein